MRMLVHMASAGQRLVGVGGSGVITAVAVGLLRRDIVARVYAGDGGLVGHLPVPLRISATAFLGLANTKRSIAIKSVPAECPGEAACRVAGGWPPCRGGRPSLRNGRADNTRGRVGDGEHQHEGGYDAIPDGLRTPRVDRLQSPSRHQTTVAILRETVRSGNKPGRLMASSYKPSQTNRSIRGGVQAKRATSIPLFLLPLAIFIPDHLGLGPVLQWAIPGAVAAVFLFTHQGSSVPAATSLLRRSTVVGTFLLVTFCSIVGYGYSQTILNWPTGLRDYVEPFRYTVQAATILLLIGRLNALDIRKAEVILGLGPLFSLACLILLNFSIPFLSPLVTTLYEGTKTSLGVENVRFSPPFSNPNVLAFFLVLCLWYYLFHMAGTYRNMVVLASAVTIFWTGSRTGWIALTICLTAYMAKLVSELVRPNGSFKNSKGDIALLISAVALLAVAGVEAILETPRLERVIAAYSTQELGREANLEIRIHQWRDVGNMALRSPVFGYGSAKYVEGLDSIDSQIGTWLARTGGVGLIAMMLLYGRTAYRQWRLATSHRRMDIGSFWVLVTVMLVAGAFLDNFRLFMVFWFVIIMATARYVQEG